MRKSSRNFRFSFFTYFAAILIALSFGYTAPQANARNDTPQSVQAQITSLAGVPNFGQVSPFLFRGGQPTDQGIQSLKNMGVNTIVNFRDDAGVKEEQLARQLRMNYVKLPWVASHNPTSSQVAAFLELLRANPKDKVFVHCHAGSDRTGTMIAVYRMVEENWTPAKAIQEMYSYHYHHFFLGNLQKYVENFPAKLSGDAVIRAVLAVTPVAAPMLATVPQVQHQ